MLTRLLAVVAPPLCIACGADAGRAAPLCRACRAGLRRAPPAEGAWAAFAYDSAAGALVRGLKFGGRLALADLMGAQLAALAPAELLRGAVVPVPVHPRHRRRRGIDHTRELADALARRAGLPLEECLERRGDPAPQVGRGRRERIRGPGGTIVLRAGFQAPETAVLVDDVVTTGATMSACISALTNGGTTRISPLAYARTTGR